MSSVLSATATPRNAPQSAPAWFGGLGMPHLGIVLTVSIAGPLIGAVFHLLKDHALQPSSLFSDVIVCLVMSVCAMASAVAIDTRLDRVLSHPARMALAVLAAAIVSTALIALLTDLVFKPLGLQVDHGGEMAPFANTIHRVAFHFSGAASWSLMLVTLYSMFEANRRATGELHAVNMAAFAVERNLIEDDLRATQARVDPKLLFDTLLEVDRAYAQSAQSGEQALDALTGYLRAALPADVSGTSTVSRELDLVEAYLAVLALRPRMSRDVVIGADPAARGTQMPAMLLLPLVRWALDPFESARLQVTVWRGTAALEFEIRSDGPSGEASAEDAIGGVRERLKHLYDGHARLEVSIGAGVRQARLEIPL